MIWQKIVAGRGRSMNNGIGTRHGKAGIVFFFLLACVAFALWAPNAGAESGFFSTQGCVGCHASPTPSTCNGCHAHGTHPSSAKSSINVAAATNKSTYAPGETISVTITGGYRTGWIRAILYNQSGVEVNRSTGTATGGMGGGAGYPITLTGPAPAVAGTYTFTASWYGNKFDMAERGGTTTFGPNWTPDPNNPNHGEEKVSTNSFTVSAANNPVPVLTTLSPTSATAGGAAFTLTVNGTGFVTGSVVRWNGVNRTTTVVSATQLTASIPATDIATAGTASVSVFNPTPGGGTSSALTLTVNPVVALTGLTINGAASMNESTTSQYTASATWSDGTAMVVVPNWSVTSGPATISAGGLLSAAAVTGNQTAVINASYISGGVTKTDSRSVTIVDVPAPLAITTASLASGTVGTAYSQTLAATGGTTPFIWSVSAGTLPAGLSLSAGGVLDGTPTAAGTSSFTVQVTGGGTATKAFSVTINAVAPTGALTTTPADGATDILVNTVITARVASGDIRTLFNRDTFTLRPGAAIAATGDDDDDESEERYGALASTTCVRDGIVQGRISYNDSHTRARFTPNCSLKFNMTYIGEIAPGGESLSAAPQTFRFTTAVERPDSDNDGGDDEEDDSPYDRRRTGRWSSYGTGKFRIQSWDYSGSTSASVTATSGPTISGTMAISETSSRLNQDGKPEGYEFPDGLVLFQADNVAPGTSATFKVTFPSGIAPGSKVYQVDTGGFHEVTGAVVEGDTVTMTVSNTDGEAGVITNPIGVAAPVASGAGSIDLSSASGGGGCSVAGRTGSGGSNIDVAMILAGLGLSVWGIRIRRRRE